MGVDVGKVMDRERLLERMRRHTGAARVRTHDLRDGRPDPPEQRALPCERCGALTEEIKCLYGNYWLRPACVRLRQGFAARAAAAQRV
jgi:hypothetical protein